MLSYISEMISFLNGSISAIMKQLTKAEENIMQVLWGLGEANVAAIIEEFPDPKPS